MQKNRKQVLSVSVTGVMAALSIIILTLFPEVVIIPLFPHLKIEFSNIPVLIAAFVCGPWSGIGVAFLKSLYQLFVTTSHSFGIGEFINFAIGVVMVLVMGSVSKKISGDNPIVTPKAFYVASVLTVIAVIIAGWLLNMLLLPLFFYVMNFPLSPGDWFKAVLATTPMNAVKAAATTLPIYPAVRIIQKTIMHKNLKFDTKSYN